MSRHQPERRWGACCYWLLGLTWLAAAAGCSADVQGPNRPPVARAGADRLAQAGVAVELDGSASFDPDGDPLQVSWSALFSPAGSRPLVEPPDELQTSFRADLPGRYLVALVVTDGRSTPVRDVLQVRVAAGCSDDGACDDGDACTADSCQQGTCVNEPLPECADGCPDDPDKTDPGQCGCGVPDDDTDSDGLADCLDGCPADPQKTEPGECGCGRPEGDCQDLCPDDPDKTEPGLCGCGVADDDSDSDGTADCLDGCPDDPDKVEPGECGCGTPEEQCQDQCPDDPDKTEPGQCGCGVPDDDGDSDGVADCNDPCPADPFDDFDGDGACAPEDCAPRNPDIGPGAVEVCNGVDDDCDGAVDDQGCPCTVEQNAGHAYMFCSGGSRWRDARDACRAAGYRLVTVDDATENSWLIDRIVADLGSDRRVWMGLNDRADEDHFVWESGQPGNYRNWAGDQPDNWFGEDCVEWQSFEDGAEWNDADCGDESAFVCESACGAWPDSDGDGWGDECDCGPLDPNRHPAGVEVCDGKDDDCDGLADGLPGCPCFAEQFGGHRYHFCPFTADWPGAQEACHALGGELVTLDSALEDSVVFGLLGARLGTSDAWHGLNDRATEGQWVWADGSAGDYTHWASDEPNDAGDGEDCGTWTSAGEWNDAACSGARVFVCESDPCPGDPYEDIDGDGLCGPDDACPIDHDPGLSGPCAAADCRELLEHSGPLPDAFYWINPAGTVLAYRVWCDMTTAGGGWTLAAIYGTDGRPAGFQSSGYPRPGASFYGQFCRDVFVPGQNNGGIRNYSIAAGPLWSASNHEVLAWVGGDTDDWVRAQLPAGCNFFDPAGWCEENTYGPFAVYRSDGSLLTGGAYACTTAHRQDGFSADPFDEFGLHLLDGQDSWGEYHCFGTGSSLGHQNMGRIFTTFESSSGDYWNVGVHSHWNESGHNNQPGALFIR